MNRLAPRFVLLFLCLFAASAAPRRILYLTATPGFRHTDSIPVSHEVFDQIARETGVLEITHTEDVSLINAANLAQYDAVYFFTSGELPLSDTQKADLLDFVRQGKGFGGSHSATDCLYTWPEYGDLIGGYFDGHPWVQQASVDVEDTGSPITSAFAPSFRFEEEFYQFRAFSRDRVRVLLTLDTRSVDLSAAGVNRTDGDFALAWIRNYGKGRVFYSAFGHFPSSFTNEPVRGMLKQALLWLTGAIEADASPRSGPSAPAPAPARVRDLAGGSGPFAPGSIVAIEGERLTSGSSFNAATLPLPPRLAGTHVEVNGASAPLFSVAPDRLLVQLPGTLTPGASAALAVSSVNRAADPVPIAIVPAAPAIVAAVRTAGAVVLYVTGLGATDPAVPAGMAAPAAPLAVTASTPTVTLDGTPVPVYFTGLAPGLAGVYQVNVLTPGGAPAGAKAVVQLAGSLSPPFSVP